MRKRWVMLSEASKRIGISRQMIAKLIRDGRVKATRFGIGTGTGAPWKIEEAEVRRLVKAYKVGFPNVKSAG